MSTSNFQTVINSVNNSKVIEMFENFKYVIFLIWLLLCISLLIAGKKKNSVFQLKIALPTPAAVKTYWYWR